MAAAPCKPEPNNLPDWLKKLDYDAYRQIRYRPETGPWHAQNLKFSLQFFAPGYLYQDGVRIHLLENGKVTDFPLTPGQFDCGTNRLLKPIPEGLRFAGLRVLYPVNQAGKQDEVAAFVGASYFRVLGAGQRYGISTRALAIDTAEPSGEEFPRLTEFWVEQPTPTASALRLFALLDSVSGAGACEFVIEPGPVTSLRVGGWWWLRKDVKKLGLAPLTSMFLVGANRTRFIPDFRPEVHDSDGLLIETAARQWEWRPLVNPVKTHHLSQFPADHMAGFGLMQRQRDFQAYQDLEDRYALRPSLWVEPDAAWGDGVVELVEIPTPDDRNDNIVAYWVPKQKAAPGQPFHWSYRLGASLEGPRRPALLRVQATRIDPPHDQRPVRFIIDFDGPKALSRPSRGQLEAKAATSRGQIRNLVTEENEVTGGWRAFFDLVLGSGEQADLRLSLHNGDQPVSETWLYHWHE